MSIKIFTDRSKCPCGVFSENTEPIFRGLWLQYGEKMLREDALSILETIDGAKVLNPTKGIIETEYGAADVNSLSTGCKAALIVLFCIRGGEDVAVDVTECGPNALDCIFDLVDGKNVSLILKHFDVVHCRDHEFIVNSDTRVYTAPDLCVELLEEII